MDRQIGYVCRSLNFYLSQRCPRLCRRRVLSQSRWPALRAVKAVKMTSLCRRPAADRKRSIPRKENTSCFFQKALLKSSMLFRLGNLLRAAISYGDGIVQYGEVPKLAEGTPLERMQVVNSGARVQIPPSPRKNPGSIDG